MGTKAAIGGSEVLAEWASRKALSRLVIVAAKVVFPGERVR